MNWISYHIGEEYLISVISFCISWRAFSVFRSQDPALELESRSRVLLISAGFFLLGINSTVHSFIHHADLNLNLLYQTLLGYCLGLLTLVVAISSEKPWSRRYFPLLYILLLIFLIPSVYETFPAFTEFRPLVWIIISYISGIVSILYVAAFYHTGLKRFLLSAFGHILICISAIALFFPTGIGSTAWIYGHLLRPMGFVILFFSMNRKELLNLRESMLYKILSAFSLLAAVPLLVFGMVLFYETIHPIDEEGRRVVVFLVMLITLASVLFFGLGMIIRLIRPLLQLKDTVDRVADGRLAEQIEAKSKDEIGKLSSAFNEMVIKLRNSFSEKDRLSKLAATGELSATLAHEIKNPLNAITVASAYIGKNYRGNLIKEFIKVIQNEASRINQLTTKLLNFAKPIKAEPVPSDINNLVKETALLLSQESKEQNVEIEIDTTNDIPVFSFDYHQIKQVLLNLVINSFDAVERDGRIKIQIRSSNGNVSLSVEDNGKGISDEDIKNIFNPFFTTKTRGTGLGLAISKKIAKEHGGDLLVESTLSKGSKFTLLLPVRR